MFEGAEPERGAGLPAVFAGAAAPRPSAASADADSDRREARPEVQVFKHALGDADLLYDHGLDRTVRRARGGGFDCLHDFHSRYDATEGRVFAVEKRIVGGVDEKLAAVGIGTRIRHRDSADYIVIVVAYLVGKFVAWIPCAPVRHRGVAFRKRVAALNHEILDDAVEFGAVVESRSGELHKIGDGIGRIRFKKFYRNISLRGRKCCLHRQSITEILRAQKRK